MYLLYRMHVGWQTMPDDACLGCSPGVTSSLWSQTCRMPSSDAGLTSSQSMWRFWSVFSLALIRNLVELRWTHLVYKMLQWTCESQQIECKPIKCQILPTWDSGIAWAKAHDEEAGRGRSFKLQGLLNEEGPKIRRVLSVLGDLSACGCFWQTSAILQGTSYRCPRCSTGTRGL